MTDDQLKDALDTNDIEFLSANRSSFDIDHRFADSDNDTLLLYALSDPDSEVYSYLLDNKADIYAENDEGENALHSIVFSGDVRRMHRLEEKYPAAIPVLLNWQSVDGTTPLLLSVVLEKMEIFAYFLKKGADVDKADYLGNAPIHSASLLGRLDMVCRLVEHHAVLNRKTKDGNYPFALAINADRLEVARYLFFLLYEPC